jgi:hypothetical protein
MEPSPSVLSRVLTAEFSELAQAMSRRSLLARVARVGLAVVGVSTVYQLVAAQPAAATDCTGCYWCGLCGRPCDQCGGAIDTCPSGTTRGNSFWSACCFCGSCGTRQYWDCCGPASCTIVQCQNNCQQGTWCGGTGSINYNCTVSILHGSCSPC